MHNNNNLKTEFGGEIGERYKIIRNCRYGNNLNVYKAHKVVNNKSRIPYVVKCYDTIEAFKIESQMLKMLKDVKNIMQMIDIYPQQSIIICECALYDLETFLGHQDYGQRHKEKDEIVKDIVSGLSELQKHNIVHTELSPKNIMYFKNKDDCDERWKLIDFDSACIVDKDDVKIITNYSAPEIIRSHENKTEIKANFAMDMFSFGLVLYFLETGHHYWDGENEIMKEELISTKHLIIDVQDPTACFIIKELLSKTILSRMSLQKFVQSTYYTGETETENKNIHRIHNTNQTHNVIFDKAVLEEPMNLDSNYISGMSEEEYRLYRAFKPFFESYHNEMKKNLEEMGSKIDNCTDAVKDLTKKIPQWLVKVKNEKVPRVFVIFPDEKDWKKPTTWMLAKPFRLLFVCEHKDQWHLPKQKGYKVLKIPQFIKKYGPWINLCLKVLSSAVGIMASNLFADGVADFLSTIFNLADNSDIIQHIQEIIDTVDSGVKTICDELPNFNPLNNESNTPYKIINESGLRELKNFLDTQENAGHFGGLVQCVEEETGEILWLCEEHRDGYSVKRTDPVVSDSPPTSPRECPPRVLSRPHPTRLKNINKQLPKLPLPTSPVFPVSPVSPASSTDTLFVEADGDGKKLYLDPTQQLENICQILFEVIDNADASRRRHFRTDDIREIAQKMRGHVNSFRLLSPIWYDEIQKVKFISILENQQYMYIHFLRSIVRYCIVKHDSTVGSKTMQASFLYNDLFEIRSIIKAGKSFNEHLSKLIETLKLSRSDIHKNSAIQIALDSFANEPQLKVNVYDNLNIISDKVLSKWYHIANQTFIETPTETENQGELFNTTPRFLDDKIVAGKSLKNLNNNETFSCIEKEIYLYHEHNLNNNDFIIKFHGYSVSNCKPVLFYDYAEHGDLYTYIQVNHDSSRNLLKDWGKKIKLAWEITQGVKFLHNQKILHLDLRSANILLKEDEMGELIPTISNFLWSRDTCDNKTFVYPKIASKEKIWKRWHDPDRLLNEENITSSSDIYSLGLLFWEIACCEKENLPFKGIQIKYLYSYLHKNNQEKMPELPKEYQRWENIVKKMCHLKAEERCNIGSVEIIMGKLYKRRSESQSSVSTLQSFKSEQLPQFSISQFKDTET